MASRIDDYALIGDCHTAGLVAQDATIHGLFLLLVDSVACLAALVEVCTPLELRRENLTTVAEFTIAAGQQIPLVLSWQPSHEPAHCPKDAQEIVNDTEVWWREWSSRCTYKGQYREQVLRSLITL